MGLLDKASDVGSNSAKKPAAIAIPVAKAIPKAKPVAKAVAKAKPVAKAATAKEPKAKRVRVASEGLPADFEIATPNARRIAGLTNFVVNLGPIFGFLFSVAILDAFTTIFAIVALAALTLNLVVVPIMSGRTLGNFVSRTKNITAAGSKPNFLHALFVNSTGILALMGIVFLMIFAGSMFSATGSEQIWASVWSVLGITFIILYFVNSSIKKGSESNQGLYDSLFGAFLVKHVPAEGEVSTGFIGKLESMATYGDRFTQRQEEKSAKKASKVVSDVKKAKKVVPDEKDDSSDKESESSEDKKVKKDKKQTK